MTCDNCCTEISDPTAVEDELGVCSECVRKIVYEYLEDCADWKSEGIY